MVQTLSFNVKLLLFNYEFVLDYMNILLLMIFFLATYFGHWNEIKKCLVNECVNELDYLYGALGFQLVI